MIGALFGGFAELLKKPALLLPCLFSSVLLLALLFFFDAAIQGFAFSLVLENALPESNPFDFPFAFFSIYPAETALIAALLLFFVVAGNWMAFAFGRYAREKKNGIGGAMGFATANLGNAFFLSLLEALVIGLFFVLALLAMQLSAINDLLALGFAVVLLVLGLLVYLVFVFLPAALAAGELTIKEALKESGSFVKKNVLQSIIFIALVSLLFFLVSGLGAQISGFVSDDILFFAVDFVFLLLAMAYAGIAIPLYYLSAQK